MNEVCGFACFWRREITKRVEDVEPERRGGGYRVPSGREWRTRAEAQRRWLERAAGIDARSELTNDK
jgi:hypothetical protein